MTSLDLTWLDSTSWPYLAWLNWTWLDLNSFALAWLDLICLGLTRLDWTCLELIWLDLAWLALTWTCFDFLFMSILGPCRTSDMGTPGCRVQSWVPKACHDCMRFLRCPPVFVAILQYFHSSIFEMTTLDLTWLDSTSWPHLAWLDWPWLDLTSFALACLDLICLGLTRLDCTCLQLIWLDLPWLALTWTCFDFLSSPTLGPCRTSDMVGEFWFLGKLKMLVKIKAKYAKMCFVSLAVTVF